MCCKSRLGTAESSAVLSLSPFYIYIYALSLPFRSLYSPPYSLFFLLLLLRAAAAAAAFYWSASTDAERATALILVLRWQSVLGRRRDFNPSAVLLLASFISVWVFVFWCREQSALDDWRTRVTHYTAKCQVGVVCSPGQHERNFVNELCEQL